MPSSQDNKQPTTTRIERTKLGRTNRGDFGCVHIFCDSHLQHLCNSWRQSLSDKTKRQRFWEHSTFVELSIDVFIKKHNNNNTSFNMKNTNYVLCMLKQTYWHVVMTCIMLHNVQIPIRIVPSVNRFAMFFWYDDILSAVMSLVLRKLTESFQTLSIP